MTDLIPAWVDGALKPVEKLEVHQRGLRHKAVSVFVMSGSKVLIQRRALGKYHTPGLWANTCCTHPLWDEKAADCAVRRLDEELGITGLYPAFRDRVEYRAPVGNNMVEHEVVDIFVGEVPPGVEPEPDPDEVMDTIWHPLATLSEEIMRRPGGFTPWLRIYLRGYAQTIFGTIPA